MNRILILLLLLGFSFTAKAQTNPILSNYLTLKDALVSSDVTKSSAAISELSKSLNASPEFPQKKDLVKQTEAMVKAGSDLEKQRAAFAGLSTVLWEAAKTQKWANQELFYQYCPMKKSYWLSTESAIKNPYYGSKMLACGNVKETLKPKN
ncbi:DUF3347 domain-containing protein [Algoriphagus lacus]|uniref:DUF3347 domain-containing protein n=1 Tax=Algoriphagus lacus TaxID=2056311 RepID=A0A418PS75_9BACT|nr:DUF3347 domain-containing protein [Algoriphagus lacus]RIW15721.1 DUF3347 domain-containing protein [Algoriphagus lacus]